MAAADSPELERLDNLIASKMRKLERAAHEIRSLLRQRRDLASALRGGAPDTSEEDTENAEDRAIRSSHALA